MKELKVWLKRRIRSKAGRDFYLHEAEDYMYDYQREDYAEKQKQKLVENVKKLAREICTQKTATRIKKSRETKVKIGAKPKLTNEQAIYCRQQCKERSLQSIADELGYSRQLIERCVKGLTFKHLNNKEKPQW